MVPNARHLVTVLDGRVTRSDWHEYLQRQGSSEAETPLPSTPRGKAAGQNQTIKEPKRSVTPHELQSKNDFEHATRRANLMRR